MLYELWLKLVEASLEADPKAFKQAELAFTNAYKRTERRAPEEHDRFHYMVHVDFHKKEYPWKIP